MRISQRPSRVSDLVTQGDMLPLPCQSKNQHIQHMHKTRMKMKMRDPLRSGIIPLSLVIEMTNLLCSLHQGKNLRGKDVTQLLIPETWDHWFFLDRLQLHQCEEEKDRQYPPPVGTPSPWVLGSSEPPHTEEAPALERSAELVWVKPSQVDPQPWGPGSPYRAILRSTLSSRAPCRATLAPCHRARLRPR